MNEKYRYMRYLSINDDVMYEIEAQIKNKDFVERIEDDIDTIYFLIRKSHVSQIKYLDGGWADKTNDNFVRNQQDGKR